LRSAYRDHICFGKKLPKGEAEEKCIYALASRGRDCRWLGGVLRSEERNGHSADRGLIKGDHLVDDCQGGNRDAVRGLKRGIVTNSFKDLGKKYGKGGRGSR